MNIANLSLFGLTSNKASKLPEGNLSSELTESDFGAILSGLTSRGLDNVQETGLNQGLAIREAMLSMTISDTCLSREQLTALIKSEANLFADLGEKLLEIASMLLQGIQSGSQEDWLASQKDKLITGLEETIGNLSSRPENDNAGRVLTELLLNVKQKASGGGLEGRVNQLVEGLPESIKLKLKVFEQKSSDDATPHSELISIQHRLIANLLGDISLQAGEEAIDQAGLSLAPGKANAIHLHEKIMIRANDEAFRLTANLHDASRAVLAGADQAAAPKLASNASFGVAEPLLEDFLLQASNISTDSGLNQKEASPAGDKSSQDRAGLSVAEELFGTDDSSFDFKREEHGEGSRSSQDTPKDVRFNLVETPATKLLSGDKAPATVQVNGSYEQVAGSRMPDAEGLIKQVVEKFDILVDGGKSEARIQLKPKHLGELRIHLIMENGSMRAVLDTSSHHVKEILEANLQSLKQSLEDQGIQVGKFNVSVGQHRESHGRGLNHSRNNSPDGLNGGDDVTQEARRMRASILLDGNLAVNYLA